MQGRICVRADLWHRVRSIGGLDAQAWAGRLPSNPPPSKAYVKNKKGELIWDFECIFFLFVKFILIFVSSIQILSSDLTFCCLLSSAFQAHVWLINHHMQAEQSILVSFTASPYKISHPQAFVVRCKSCDLHNSCWVWCIHWDMSCRPIGCDKIKKQVNTKCVSKMHLLTSRFHDDISVE